MGAFKDCKVTMVFEGNRHGIQRSTGDSEIKDFWNFGAAITLEPHKDTLETILSKLSDMAQEMASQMQQRSFQLLSTTSEEHGQVVDGDGKTLTESILEVIEKVEIPLNSAGELDMSNMKLIVGPGVAERLQQIDYSKEIQGKLAAILERKEAAARDREANRELVG